jgi:hypothetical protein
MIDFVSGAELPLLPLQLIDRKNPDLPCASVVRWTLLAFQVAY